MAKNTLAELQQLQALPLDVKIVKTMQRIHEWVDRYGEDGVYVSFSGGKDSTVLLDIVRNRCGYTNVPAVFVDTGLEYPEIREFVKKFDNVVWLKPKMNFKQVIQKYGYPFISKEVSGTVSETIGWINKHTEGNDRLNEIEKKIRTGEIDIQDVPVRLCHLLGMFDKYQQKKIDVPQEDRSLFCKEKWKFLIDGKYKFSNQCCNVMKKNPVHKYGKDTGRKAITGQTASESKLRTRQWLANGCNGFDMAIPISNPISFWTEQDVLLYIKLNDIHIASVYGGVVEDSDEMLEGQMHIFDYDPNAGIFDKGYPLLKTTGCDRTGCMFCGYGCHLEKGEGRFKMMKRTHPKQYEWIMKPWSEGGLGYKDVIDWLNEHGNVDIRY